MTWLEPKSVSRFFDEILFLKDDFVFFRTLHVNKYSSTYLYNRTFRYQNTKKLVLTTEQFNNLTPPWPNVLFSYRGNLKHLDNRMFCSVIEINFTLITKQTMSSVIEVLLYIKLWWVSKFTKSTVVCTSMTKLVVIEATKSPFW